VGHKREKVEQGRGSGRQDRTKTTKRTPLVARRDKDKQQEGGRGRRGGSGMRVGSNQGTWDTRQGVDWARDCTHWGDAERGTLPPFHREPVASSQPRMGHGVAAPNGLGTMTPPSPSTTHCLHPLQAPFPFTTHVPLARPTPTAFHVCTPTHSPFFSHTRDQSQKGRTHKASGWVTHTQ